MGIIKKINSLRGCVAHFLFNKYKNENRTRNNNSSGNNTVVDLRQREIEIHGEERIQQQRLYERWVTKDVWHLKNEALPLLFGFDPENKSRIRNGNDFNSKIDELWAHAQKCVEQGLLAVKNNNDEPDNWQIKPAVIYRWATVSRVYVPQEFTVLMEFVLSTVKQTDNSDRNYNEAGNNITDASVFDNDKERILGAALAILAAYPGKCKNNKGRIQANKIVDIINERGEFWFGSQIPSLSNSAMTDLINRWLQTVC